MFNKRGEVEITWNFVFTLLFVIAIIIILGIWISAQKSGSAIKKQILAKEVCMLVTSAEPGTQILIEHDKKITIEKKDSKVVVRTGEFDIGYSYDCYLKDIEFSRKDDITIIEIK